MEVKSTGTAVVKAGIGRMRRQKVSGFGEFQPQLGVIRFPACPACQAPNPNGMQNCPTCGLPAPLPTDLQTIEAVVPDLDRFFPWHARAALAIAAFFHRLYNKL